MRKTLLFVVLLTSTLLAVLPVEAKTIGKLFIKVAPVPEGEFADPKLEDSVKDMKDRKGEFTIATDEAEADFLIVVLERKVMPSNFLGESTNDPTIYATLSVKDGTEWKPAIKLEGGGASWGLAARAVIRNAHKWVKANPKK